MWGLAKTMKLDGSRGDCLHVLSQLYDALITKS